MNETGNLVTWEAVAMAAYRAYAIAVKYRHYDRTIMAEWHDLPASLQEAWLAAVKEAVSVNGGHEPCPD